VSPFGVVSKATEDVVGDSRMAVRIERSSLQLVLSGEQGAEGFGDVVAGDFPFQAHAVDDQIENLHGECERIVVAEFGIDESLGFLEVGERGGVQEDPEPPSEPLVPRTWGNRFPTIQRFSHKFALLVTNLRRKASIFRSRTITLGGEQARVSLHIDEVTPSTCHVRT
jgi:hypothetical protein